MEETGPKTFIFVLMPFSSEFEDIYEVGIKAACKDAGAYCERVDEQIFTENILERIYNQIAKADVVVADMTGRNPNVFYETGYAHALNKQVILLTRSATDIPFDLTHYPHIVYEGKIAVLKTQLEKRIRWCIENPRDSLGNVDLNLQFSIGGVPMTETPVIKINNVNYSYFSIDIHNLTGRTITSQAFELALITPSRVEFKTPRVPSAARLPGGEYLYTLEHTRSIFPFGWLSLEVVLELTQKYDQPIDMILRFFTELGFKDYSFTAIHD